MDNPVLTHNSEQQQEAKGTTLPTNLFDVRLAEELDERIEYAQWKVTVTK